MRNITCLALVALAAACGSSATSSPDAAGPGPDTKQVQPCDRAVALCAKLEACAPFLLAAAYGDVTGCTDRLLKVCTAQSQSDGSGMTQANILACDAALATATCNDVFANNVSGCVFHGTYADGATCGDSSQCASGFCSHGGILCGVCTAKGAAGAPSWVYTFVSTPYPVATRNPAKSDAIVRRRRRAISCGEGPRMTFRATQD